MNLKYNFILYVAFFCLMIFLVLFYVVKKINKSNPKQDTPINIKKYNVLSILCILIVGLSWVTNFGWIRFFLFIPMVFHAFLFYFSNQSYRRNISKDSSIMFFVNISIYITFTLGYILMPDGGDTVDSIRVFFGLIKNDLLINIAAISSDILHKLNFILIIIQIIYTVKIKKSLKVKDNLI